ncbi:MAG: hypothetical protein ACTSUE_22030 [Promethearchaeota archaeon]
MGVSDKEKKALEKVKSMWHKAKENWSKYTRLKDPRFLVEKKEINKSQMVAQIAQIGLADLQIEVNIKEIVNLGVEDEIEAILSHEIGHHMLAPGNLINHARMMSFVSKLLNGRQKSFVVNIFTDLLINDYLYTNINLPIDKVYIALKKRAETANKESDVKTGGEFWQLYMRIYEILWRLPEGTMSSGKDTVPGIPPQRVKEIERDAKLAARAIRTFSKRWFVALKILTYIFKPYLPEEMVVWLKGMAPAFDEAVAGEGALDKIWGFSKIGSDEMDKPTDRNYDGALSDLLKKEGGTKGNSGGSGRIRSPADYITTLKDIGVIDDPTKALIQYYTELAYPHLIPFPKTEHFTTEPLMEGTEPWDISDSMDTLDYIESIKESPVLFPGITTMKRRYGETKGTDKHEVPIDIDIYIDTSGSMPAPGIIKSHPTIGAFILCLSALRAGASVQTTSWSGKKQVISTAGFSKNKEKILGTLLHFWGDGTQFPLSVFERYKDRKPDDPPVHIIIISDAGVDTMLGDYQDRDGNLCKGIDICKLAMEKGKAKGTLLLNISGSYFQKISEKMQSLESIGFKAYQIMDWEDIIKFAREFSREHYS